MTELSMSDMIRSGRPAHQLSEEDILRIKKETEQEPCEICGKETGKVGPLFAQDAKDEKGNHIVKMVCAKCLKSSKKRRIKA